MAGNGQVDARSRINTANGNAISGFTELNISSEVDRILNQINVNDFIKIDKNHPSQPAETVVQDKSPSTTSQANGTTTSSATEIPPVTSILAEFISTATPSLLAPALTSQLHSCILDFIAVTAAGSHIAPSSPAILNGLLAFTHSQTLPQNRGGCTVITHPQQTYPPAHAALLNATFGHSFDFDDTHATSSLHAGVTAIAATLAEAEYQLRSGTARPTPTDILLAILLSYDTTIRIGVALSTLSYPRGFHNTSVAGIFGAVAAISSLRHLPPDKIQHAFGLAGSKAAGSMQYLANGSHNKRLHPGFAAHDAFLCVSLAQAGVIGADKIIEGDLGLLQAYTDRERSDVDWARLIGGLGQTWEFEDSALKPYAGCRMTHVFIEMAGELGQNLRGGKWAASGVKKIQKIRCSMPKANVILVGQRLPNKVHPENIVDAQFSCYFQVANAVLHGGSHDMAAYDRLGDGDVRGMCDVIECVADESMKGMSGRMDVWLVDGEGEVVEVVRREMREPLGERGHPFGRNGEREKFRGLMGPVFGSDVSERVVEAVEGFGVQKEDGEGGVLELMDLLARPLSRD